ncbi:winged helix-turn-helix domain-containing protein [Corynebacterium durum]|nr:winged helix-turn-helix domain-containing protein [Corynebacterium durum]WJY84800.1 Helix-turn-helix domain protein [Corynebacterium durum]
MKPPTSEQPPSQLPSQREQELDRRLTTIEARLAALEEHVPKETATTPTGTKQVDNDADTYWALTELSSRNNTADNTGAVMFAGHVTTSEQEAMYQWTRPTDFFLTSSWDDPMTRLTALAHPVRGTILRTLLDAPATAAQLAEKNVVTSTGTAYHHLNALMAAGWISKKPTGDFSIRVSRIVPLLTILACCEDH